jgi:hypothetical protein
MLIILYFKYFKIIYVVILSFNYSKIAIFIKNKIKRDSMEIYNVPQANRENFKKFNLKDDALCKLEFIFQSVGYQIKYCDEDFGTYETDNRNSLIKEFLEELAEFNNGDSKGVKARLDSLIEEKSQALYQQYQTTYKNSILKYLLGLEDNIIKSVCMEKKLTYQQLADEIGLSESSLRSAASTNKVSKQVEKSIEMYLKIIHLENELEEANKIKNILKSWLK